MAIPERQPDADGNGHEARLAALLARVEAVLAARDGGHWPELMGQATAARYLDASENTVRVWRLRAGLPFVVLPPVGAGTRGQVRYRRRDLDKWAAGHRSRAPRGSA